VKNPQRLLSIAPVCPYKPVSAELLPYLLKIKLKSLRLLLGLDGQEAVSYKTESPISLPFQSFQKLNFLFWRMRAISQDCRFSELERTLESNVEPSFLR
jgi:hypothetical protein